MQNYDGKRLK